MIILDNAVTELTNKYSKYGVDSFSIRKTILDNMKRGLSLEQAVTTTDNILYKAYTMRRA